MWTRSIAASAVLFQVALVPATRLGPTGDRLSSRDVDQIATVACRDQAPVLLAISQARRLALRQRTSDDPHALGYRLVRAAADRARDPRLVLDRLTLLLHDLAGFARVSGLAGKSSRAPLTLARPVNAAVIPEVTFVFDGGAALDVHRRLRVSPSPLEH